MSPKSTKRIGGLDRRSEPTLQLNFDSSQLTTVVQGPLPDDYDIRYVATHLKAIFPGSRVICSTMRPIGSAKLPNLDTFDDVVLCDDPGALPGLKFDEKANNGNRQRATTRAGLNAVSTTYAMKLRSDCALRSNAILKYWAASESEPDPFRRGKGRIIAPSLFTINPRLDERLAYHVSDVFQFGYAEDLQRYWNAPNMPFDVASWYEPGWHARGSTGRERQFRSRFAVEQWFCLHYLFTEELPIRFHNDISSEILHEFERHLAASFLILHPYDLDMIVPRFAWAIRNPYFSALCYTYEDWKRLLPGSSKILKELHGYSQWPYSDSHRAIVSTLFGTKAGRSILEKLALRLPHGNMSSRMPVGMGN